MTKRGNPWRIALLDHLLRNNEPLVGDLIEEWPRRSRAWFWRQIMFAVLARAMTATWATLRQPQRLEGGLASVAMFIILSFQVVVAGSLLNDLIQRVDRTQLTRIDHPEWLVFVVPLSLPVAWIIGKAMSRLHRRSRVATVLVYGASAAIVAAVTLSVLNSEATGFAAMGFVLALLVGSSSCSPLDRQA
jgi:hypothetical protein